MHNIPTDLPDEAPRPDGRPRCESEFDGKRCGRLLGHEDRMKRESHHHVAPDGTRWTIGAKSGMPQVVPMCTATYQGMYTCKRWRHGGDHVAIAQYPPGKIPRSERIEWSGDGDKARRRIPEYDDGYRTEGEYQAMYYGGVTW